MYRGIVGSPSQDLSKLGDIVLEIGLPEKGTHMLLGGFGAMERPSSRSKLRASLQPRRVTACLKALVGGREVGRSGMKGD